MGTYVYALKKSLRKNAILNGMKIQVDVASYAYKPSRFGTDTQDFGLKMWLDRASETPEEEQAPYIAFCDGNIDGYPVHVNNKHGVWSDGSGYWTGITADDIVGKAYKIGNRYHIVPKEQDLEEFIKTNFPKHYSKPLPHTQVYVKMHQGYTATVRDIKSLKEYLAGYGKMDPNFMQTITVGDDVPSWFESIVRKLVTAKRRELESAEV